MIPPITKEFRAKYRPENAPVDWKELQVQRSRLREAVKARRFADLDRILGEAQRAFEANPAAEPGIYWLLDAFRHSTQGLDEDLAAWRDAAPDNPFPHAARAMHLEALGWAARGGKTIDKTSREQYLGMLDRFEMAEAEALEALRLNPRLITAYIPLIAVARGASSPDMGKYVRAALKINPASYQTLFSYLFNLTPRWGGSHGQMDRFMESAKEAAELNPEIKALEGLADWDRGRVNYSDERYDSARIYFERAVGAGGYFDAHLELGRTLIKLGRHEAALREIDRAIAVRPLIAECHVEKALLLFRMGRKAESDRVHREAGILDPWDKNVQGLPNRVANILVEDAFRAMNEKDYPRGLGLVEEALRLNPAKADAFYYRAHLRIRTRDEAGAVTDAQEAARLDPNDFKACKLVDDLLIRRRDWPGILRCWDTFLAHQPGHAEALFERAGTNFHAGHHHQAKRDFQSACDLGIAEACRVRQSKYP